MTGRENIFMNGAIMGMTKAEIRRKMDEIVDFSGCERYIDTPVKRYSSGMTVRLGFAVAAHLEPEILVVDEVLAVGDAEFQKKAIGKMQDISKGEGRTVLFVSHNMGAIRSLCDTGIVLMNGETIFCGTTENAVNIYLKSAINPNNKPLLEFAKYESTKLVIDQILVNNLVGNVVKINKDEIEINFYIKGFIKQDLKIALELKIYDDKEMPLAFYSPNHESGYTQLYKAGEFELSRTLKLPKGISQGTYYADVFLTSPLIEIYVEFIKSLVIEAEGCPTKTGFIFEYSKGHGWLFLH